MPVVQTSLCEGSGINLAGTDGCQGSSLNQAATVKPLSYADTVTANNSKKVNFRALASSVMQDGCDVVLPRESVRVMSDKLANTLYGYFLGDHFAFPVVDYFVRKNWKNYGLEKTMMNANGFFFFKFSDELGMLNVLKDGPWIIKSQPMFLNSWTPTTKLEKKEVKKVQVWVKIHEVPIAAYTEDGLSLIATTIGEPKMLDSFTASMCTDSWGRSSYARALMEISADKELREEVTMAIPEPEGEGFVKETMYVEYEWSPYRCAKCCVFGYSNEMCPKQPLKETKVRYESQKRNNQQIKPTKKMPTVDQDGYTEVYGKKMARRVGIPVNKQKSKFEYRPVGPKPKGDGNNASSSNTFRSNNPFEILNAVDTSSGPSNSGRGPDDSDDDDVTKVYNEMDDFMMNGSLNINSKKGASTPSLEVKDEVRQAVKDYNLSLCAILESHVDIGKPDKVCKSVFRNWDWTSNGAKCVKGIRIIIGWNPAIFDVVVLDQSDQVMHLQLIFKLDKRMVFCSIVYAANYYVSRRSLWQNLSMHKVLVGDDPWFVMGDFNSVLNLEDKSMGASSISVGMKDFQSCVDDIEMFDINSSGFHFTWNQKPKKGVGLLKKIDRVLGNTQFVALFPRAVALFHPYRLSDHCPSILKIPEAGKLKPRSFKFANFLVHKPEFLEIVNRGWNTRINGVHQFCVVKRLRLLKKPLRALLFKQGNLHNKTKDLRVKLDSLQQSIDRDPSNAVLRAEEVTIMSSYQEALLDEERFLKQKSKVDWLRAGDMNTAFFHSSLKNRNHRSRIEVIQDSVGNVFEGDRVHDAFVSHYEKFLGCEGDISLNRRQIYLLKS
ncbi:uncharacterized protein LOC110919113 [Helianthus annuus]|uniref:uncharacterized protein LOC110919113 n=1 Tax=Helianthus annuus TaxID=4232 RepID=UPI000B8FC91D|nr:uncharacterized protein LOC110919113 [Helianthus annuus]